LKDVLGTLITGTILLYCLLRYYTSILILTASHYLGEVGTSCVNSVGTKLRFKHLKPSGKYIYLLHNQL